jgi:hypothetical protein
MTISCCCPFAVFSAKQAAAAMSYWYIGAILSVIGSVASNLGVNVQKYSFMQNEKLPEVRRKPYYKQACVCLCVCTVAA